MVIVGTIEAVQAKLNALMAELGEDATVQMAILWSRL